MTQEQSPNVQTDNERVWICILPPGRSERMGLERREHLPSRMMMGMMGCFCPSPQTHSTRLATRVLRRRKESWKEESRQVKGREREKGPGDVMRTQLLLLLAAHASAQGCHSISLLRPLVPASKCSSFAKWRESGARFLGRQVALTVSLGMRLD